MPLNLSQVSYACDGSRPMPDCSCCSVRVHTPPLTTARSSDLMWWACPSVCLSVSPSVVKMQKCDFLKNYKQFRTTVTVDDLHFKGPIIWLVTSKMAEIQHLENRRHFLPWAVRFRKNMQTSAEWHADSGDKWSKTKVETGSRIPIWRTFVFRNRK